MSLSIEKNAGIALLTGSALMLATMVVHPEGGNLQHLLRISRTVVVSHSMALLAIPFLGIGFWGLTQRLGVNHFLPLLSFFFVVTGLFAGMMAATINGLALPIFIQNYKEVTVEAATSIKPILKNNISLNQAFDYVFLGAISLSILFWSISILTLRKLQRWIGYFGLTLSLTAISIFISGYMIVNLHGFRLFILSYVIWISLVGIALIKRKEQSV